MSGSSGDHSFRDIANNVAVSAAVAAGTLGNMTPAALSAAHVDPVDDAALTSQVETLADDSSQGTEAVYDSMEKSDASEREIQGLPDDPPGEHRDPAPDSFFGPEYMANAESFAEKGIDGAALDVGVDAGPDGGIW